LAAAPNRPREEVGVDNAAPQAAIGKSTFTCLQLLLLIHYCPRKRRQ